MLFYGIAEDLAYYYYYFLTRKWLHPTSTIVQKSVYTILTFSMKNWPHNSSSAVGWGGFADPLLQERLLLSNHESFSLILCFFLVKKAPLNVDFTIV